MSSSTSSSARAEVTEPVIAVSGLTKRFGSVLAVDDLDFSVDQGDVCGLLGPNGAGKTTTIGMLTTRVIPTSGRAFVAGIDVVADPAHALPKPLYLRGPDARPQAGLARR